MITSRVSPVVGRLGGMRAISGSGTGEGVGAPQCMLLVDKPGADVKGAGMEADDDEVGFEWRERFTVGAVATVILDRFLEGIVWT